VSWRGCVAVAERPAEASRLLGWIEALPRAPHHVYLVHGEPEAADSLRQAIAERCGWPCSTPECMELVSA
jgi:metallo-beta-lactamase family protein